MGTRAALSMPDHTLLYYITDRRQFPGDEVQRREKLLAKVEEAVACGVDFIQLREKDLSSRELEALATQVLATVRNQQRRGRQPATRLLINSRCDVALAVGADGVHLRSHDVSVQDARKAREGSASGNQKRETGAWVVAVSCHRDEEVRRAAAEGADFVVFAPVFEKKGVRPTGLDALHRACQISIPVFALGGVALENAQSCLDAGAAGIAGIRLFQENNILEVVRQIRGSHL